MLGKHLEGSSPDAEGGEVNELKVLSYIFKQIDLLSQRRKRDDEAGERALRAPVCLDATEAGIKSLAAIARSATHRLVAHHRRACR